MKTIKSYVKRQGRLTTGQETALINLWQKFGIDWTEGPLYLSQFFSQNAPLHLEIGYGNGEVLLDLARNHPQQNFIGIEVYPSGIGSLLRQIAIHHLENIRLLRTDASVLLEKAFPTASLDSVAILFPDPWPKRRHHKRRLIQPDFALTLARVLRPGGHLRLATDWHDYALHMLTVLEHCAHFKNIVGPYQFSARPHERPISRFERRGQLHGYRCAELLYQRL